jgi:hypothetical protein
MIGNTVRARNRETITTMLSAFANATNVLKDLFEGPSFVVAVIGFSLVVLGLVITIQG